MKTELRAIGRGGHVSFEIWFNDECIGTIVPVNGKPGVFIRSRRLTSISLHREDGERGVIVEAE